MPPRRELGENALSFARWYTTSKFRLMEDFVGDLETYHGARDIPALRSRFLRATRHGQRVMSARLVVTILLAFSVVATVAGALVTAIAVPSIFQNDVAATQQAITRIAAATGSLSILFLVLRLAFDRYLDLVQVSATFLAVELAAARAAGGRPDARAPAMAEDARPGGRESGAPA